MLLPLSEIQNKGLLELLGSRLKHLCDILEICNYRSPTLLLKMLIMN